MSLPALSPLELAERQALKVLQVRALALASSVRLGLIGLFLPLATLQAQRGHADWAVYVQALGVYALPTFALFALRKYPFVRSLAGPAWVLDVMVVYWLQHDSMPLSPFPAGVAGFSLGLFTLLISLSASAMSRVAPFTTAGAAIVGQAMLMHEAGISAGPTAAAAGVLAFTALVNLSIIARLRGIVLSLTGSEVQRRFETERFQALDAAKQTIETMLVQAKGQNEKLLELQKDKDVLSALLVHDLRAPLGAVRANLDFVKGELPANGDPDVLSALSEARQVTDRLASMISDLLNITRLEESSLPLEAASLSPQQLLTSLHKQFSVQARSRSITVSLEVADVPALNADRNLLTRTIENLASNALRYTPSQGRVQLDVHQEGNDCVFAVRNDGQPIPLEARSRLFDKFVQGGSASENRRAGWGLGLYFCRLVANAHGGSVALEDAEGWATSFVVRVPLGGPAVQRAA